MDPDMQFVGVVNGTTTQSQAVDGKTVRNRHVSVECGTRPPDPEYGRPWKPNEGGSVNVSFFSDVPFPTLEDGEKYIIGFKKVDDDFQFGPAADPPAPEDAPATDPPAPEDDPNAENKKPDWDLTGSLGIPESS